MSTITETVDVAVPVRTAYNQWTQFEQFPRFMEGVEEIVQLNDTRTHWKVDIGGVTREFDAEIITQEPDTAISWQSVESPRQAGAVGFQEIDANTTRVTVRMEFEPDGLVEQAGDKLGIVERRVKGDVERFKKMIESQGAADGAWRGEVKNNEPQ